MTDIAQRIGRLKLAPRTLVGTTGSTRVSVLDIPIPINRSVRIHYLQEIPGRQPAGAWAFVMGFRQRLMVFPETPMSLGTSEKTEHT